jgi:predicted Zn-dependent protease
MRVFAVLLVLAALLPRPALAQAPLAGEIARLESGWAVANYQVKGEAAQVAALDPLIARAMSLGQRFPGRAEPLVWTGVLQTTKAGVVGGMAGFGLVKAARQVLEQADRIDPKACNGLGLSQLGTLFYQVPGFPIAFGNRVKARAYLERALAIAPEGLAANLAYGDFLVTGGNPAKAETVLRHALAAPKDVAQPVADAGRRAEVEVLLAKIQRH